MIHETPSEELFNEIKQASINIWKDNYNNEHGYVDEKVDIINSTLNYADNVMKFYRMFDHTNQQKLRSAVSDEALEYIDNNY